MNAAIVGMDGISNFYDRDNMGRDSPGALLDMLAEVASQTLHSEKKLDEMDAKKVKQRENKRSKNHQTVFNVTQLLSMPATQLVKLFSIFSSDELKRQYSYSCALVPGCGQSYTSFASEGRARMSIKSHLADHLEFLKNNADTYSTFTATAVNYSKPKSTAQNKKVKLPQNKKPLKETLNKENKDTKAGKSNNYLRKILSNEVNLKEMENNSEQDNKITDLKNIYMSEMKRAERVVDTKVLGDHSYYEHRDDNFDESTSSYQRVPVNSLSNENIMLMVVENDNNPEKDLLKSDKKSIKIDNTSESMTLWKDDLYNSNADTFVPAKPKGKAKFIGTSKEEREMALVLIEKIRKKGNPTGNNLQCRICDPPRTFTAPTTLVSHYRSHAGIKPYECRICRAVFTRRHSLKYHMLIHQNQTRFTCADCGKKFRHPSHFREHRRRHTGESPFGCDDCGQRFKTRNTYKRHLKTRHGKVLTISGELLHLSEEDSKKVRTKNRRKKEIVENITNENTNAIESIVDYATQQNEDYNWVEKQIFENDTNECNIEPSIENTIWMYENSNYKTELKETELENNFVNNEVVVEESTNIDENLEFSDVHYAEDNDVYTKNDENMELGISCNVDENAAVEAQNMNENQIFIKTEAIFEYQDNKNDENMMIGETEDNQVLINQENDYENTKEDIFSTANINLTPQENVVEEINKNTVQENINETLNIIPCQVKVCDSNGRTLQFLNNSKITLKKAQSINVVQNGKQHTFLLLASDDDNILQIDPSTLDVSKTLPVVAVPAE